MEVPREVHGLWHAQLFDRGGVTVVHEALWVLSLSDTLSNPSALGASKPPPTPGAETEEGKETTTVLYGTWAPPPRNVVTLKEMRIPGESTTSENEPMRKYTASVAGSSLSSGGGDDGTSAGAGSLVLRGTWTDCCETREGGNDCGGGIFIAVREHDDETAHVSGLWLGTTAPIDSLAGVVPSNPIRWALSVVRDNRCATATVFGAGFFDDAADVPGKPVLLFSLCSTSSAAGERLCFEKVYEACAGGRGAAVSYEALLTGPQDGAKDRLWQLRGSWVNAGAGTSGTFACSRTCYGTVSGSGDSAAAVCACEVCGCPVLPGDARWCCRTCVPLWSCCAACKCKANPAGTAQTRGDGSGHEHELELEVSYMVEYARGTTCARLVRDALARFAARPFLGVRSRGADSYKWATYGEIGSRIASFSLGLRGQLGERASWREGGTRPRFLMCADISVDYTIAMLGALDAGLVIVPVHSCLDRQSLAHVVSTTAPVACYVSDGPPSVGIREMTGGAAFILTNTSDVSCGGHGEDGWVPPDLPLDEVSAVLFTSGTTGLPKGAVFTEELMLPSEGVANVQPFVRLDFQAFDPSFLLSVMSTVHCGGQRAFSSVATMVEDMRIARPTHMGAAPSFWNSLYRDFALRSSQLCRERGIGIREAEDIAARECRASLGNRLVVATSGGAPISPEVAAFVKRHLRIGLADLYGTRETGGIARDGIVLLGVDVLLLPVPELGFLGDPDGGPKEREVGRVYRGEVCVFSPRLVPGYLGDAAGGHGGGGVARPPAKWATVSGKSYYRTGDVGELHVDASGKRRLNVIDRLGGQTKLAQGEWLAASRVETILEECPCIRQAFVMASPSEKVPVAVVVPSVELDVSKRTEGFILSEVRLLCSKRVLRPFEIPQAVTIESEEWTPENGMLTSTSKKRRDVLTARYATARDAMYASLKSSTGSEPMDGSGGDGGVSGELVTILREALSTPNLSGVNGAQTLEQLGCDSVITARVIRMLKEKGLALDMASLFELTLGQLSDMLSAAASGDHPELAVTPESHFLKPVVDWEAECRLPSDIPRQAKKRGDSDPKDILLTGATGFLGPVLAAEILQRYPSRVSLFCIVRAKDCESAMHRLIHDMEAAGVWSEEIRSRIIALSGDVSAPLFGLSEAAYADAVRRVGLVFHNAARVNAVLPYRVLRHPNVGGTITAVKFALESGSQLVFISSVSAITSGESMEEGWPMTLPQRIPENTRPYGQTKAVSERLIRTAVDEFGLDAIVVRPSSIGGSTVTGFTNELDCGVLTIAAISALGSVPERSLEKDLRWIPVDFVAGATVSLAMLHERKQLTQRVFHLTGSHGPLVSEIVIALRASGIPVETVSEEKWCELVKGLPEGTRIATVRNVLNALGHHDVAAAANAKWPTHRSTELVLRESAGLTWPSAPTAAYLLKAVAFLKRRNYFANVIKVPK